MRASNPARLNAAARSLWAGGVYFAVVFTLAFGLGVIRTLVTAPRFGATAAVLLEVPALLAISWFASRGCVARFNVPPTAKARIAMGLLAFLLTLLAELALSVLLFGRTVSEHLAIYTQFVGLTGLAAQVLFALIPWAQGSGVGTAPGSRRP